MMTVSFKKLDARAVLPRRGSALAAGADLCALLDSPVTVSPGETEKIPTGLSLELPIGYAAFVYARSGSATKRGLAPANKVGVIDCDYRGEIMVAIHNHSAESKTVSDGERIAQLVITPYYTAEYEETDQLSDTVRGEGGFGSTGRK